MITNLCELYISEQQIFILFGQYLIHHPYNMKYQNKRD